MASTYPEKVAIISAGNSPLGAYLASKLLEKNYAVLLQYHQNAEKIIALNELAKRRNLFFGTCQIDFREDDACAKVAVALDEAFPKKIQTLALLNNFGLYFDEAYEEVSPKNWRDSLLGAQVAYYLTVALLPRLRQAEVARVVNIGDSATAHNQARKHAPAYHFGKSAILQMSKDFALREAKNGVTFNVVSPGLLRNSQGLNSRRQVPAGRYGEFADVWHGVKFFLSKNSSYTSGSNLLVAGAWNL